MRVQYDDQIVMHQTHGGVSRYFVELVRELRADPGLGVIPDLDWRRSRNEHAVAAGLGRPASRWRRRLHRLRRRLPALPGRRPDLVHPTWYYEDRLPPASGPPIAVTVVDMIPELMPELFGPGRQHLAKESYARRATLVVCISESTRNDLLEVYGPLEAQVEVVHLGVGTRFRPGLARPPGAPADYLLFAGNRRGYKDFGIALEAFAGIRAGHPEVELLAIGGGTFSRRETEEVEGRSLRGAVRQVDASDDELPAYFGNALAFLFPSRYEGFGLPTLEAMASGTPVVLAASSSHHEVGGEVARYFPPGDADELAAQVVRVLDDSALRAKLAARGIERAAGFTWRRTAERTAALYRSIATTMG